MSAETPNGGAGGKTGEPMVYYVYGLFPFEFKKEKNPNMKHSKPSEFMIFFT